MNPTTVLTGKVALVTGASRGVGKGVAVALGAAGATVYVTGRSRAGQQPTVPLAGSIDETADLVSRAGEGTAGGRGIAIACDHADDQQNRALIAAILQAEGKIDMLVNCAWGGYQAKQRAGKGGGGSGFKTPFWKMPPDFIDSMFAVGVRATYMLSTLAAAAMAARHSGLIVHLTANLTPGAGDNVAYAASKAAVNAMAAEMGKLLAPEGVTVVALAPDHVATEMLMAGRKSQALAAWMESPVFVGRAVVALASDPEMGRFAGQILRTRVLARGYGFSDLDGHQPTLRE